MIQSRAILNPCKEWLLPSIVIHKAVKRCDEICFKHLERYLPPVKEVQSAWSSL